MNLNISEDFYSVQGEGFSNGVPSYFIRLGNCDLCCGGKNGKWLKKGTATWKCDSEQFINNFKSFEPEYLIDKWKELDILEDIINGHIHVIFSGGEPMLPENQEAILSFIEKMDNEYYLNKIFYEIETNGTVEIDEILFNRLNQINCSPKLSNSGNPKEKRINIKSLRQILGHQNSWFKLVVSGESDVTEFQEDFVSPLIDDMLENTTNLFYQVSPLRLPSDFYSYIMSKVIVMPAMDNRDKYFEFLGMVYEMAKKYRIRATGRNHIAVWDRSTGV